MGGKGLRPGAKSTDISDSQPEELLCLYDDISTWFLITRGRVDDAAAVDADVPVAAFAAGDLPALAAAE